ncbi:MAG: class I SAM-dependent methyltransferase [Rectinemataceae bacterium]
MFDEERWAEVPGVVDSLERLAEIAAGASVLDACCGPGRHSIELASRGYRVTGVDITETYLEAARESATGLGLPLEFFKADIRNFVRPDCFDLAINLYTSFGYFSSPEEDLIALGNIRRSLRSGGVFVLETSGKETAVRDFTEGERFERAGWMVQTEYEVVGAWEGLRNRWILTRADPLDPEGREETIDRSFVLRLYSATELKAVLLRAGFSSVELYGSLEGARYDQNAIGLVAMARC